MVPASRSMDTDYFVVNAVCKEFMDPQYNSFYANNKDDHCWLIWLQDG